MRVHLAHANGFPSAVYQPLSKRIDAETFSIPMLGHDPAFPIDEEWNALAAQLQHYIAGFGKEPVVLVGHSLGALLSFKAALAVPEKVKALILLDPPLIYGPTAWIFRAAKLAGAIDRVTPAHLSIRRRYYWPSTEEAHQYFNSKALFRNLHKDAFVAWMEHGLVKTPDGYRLAFEVQKEVEIFRNTPLHLNRLKGPLKMPAWLVYGKQSEACWSRCVSPFARDFGLNVLQTEGGHMFPLTQLDETASIINRCLDTLN